MTTSPVQELARDTARLLITALITVFGVLAIPFVAFWMLALMQGVSPLVLLP